MSKSKHVPYKGEIYLKIDMTDKICKYLKENLHKNEVIEFIKKIDPIELAKCTDDKMIWFVKIMKNIYDVFNPNEDYFSIYFFDVVNTVTLKKLIEKKIGLGINAIKSSNWFFGHHYVFYFGVYGRNFELDKNVSEMTGLPLEIVMEDFYCRVKKVFEKFGKVSQPYIAFDFILRNIKSSELLRYHAIGVRIDPSDRRLAILWNVLQMWEDPIPKGYRILEMEVKDKNTWDEFRVPGYFEGLVKWMEFG